MSHEHSEKTFFFFSNNAADLGVWQWCACLQATK